MSSNAPKEITEANSRLRNKSHEEWIADLLKVPASIRDAIAKLVWWDWVSGADATSRNPVWDSYLKFSAADHSDKDLRKGLMLVGYTEYQASARIGGGI